MATVSIPQRVFRRRAPGPRPQRSTPKQKKPISDQQKKAIAKETLMKTEVIPFPALQEKGELPAGDVRHHLPTPVLNKLYFKAVKNLASGHGRASFESKSLGSGTVTFKIKLQLSSESALKMSSGIVNSAHRASGSTSKYHVAALEKLVLADGTSDDSSV